MVERKRVRALAWAAAALGAPCLVACGARPGASAAARSSAHGGQFFAHDNFPSRHVAPRRVDVWLPPPLSETDSALRVLYMHDGQAMFARGGMGGDGWAIDRHLAVLGRAGLVRPTMVVAIWNTPERWFEYAPAPVDALAAPLRRAMLGIAPDAPMRPTRSDAYLRFIALELKPFIDRQYHTLPGRADTLLGGSSMAGLVSLYGLASYPDVFGAAACLSTHWPVSANRALLDPSARVMVDAIGASYLAWLAAHLPQAGHHRLYFDHGTRNLDARYDPFQRQMDAIGAARGYRNGVDWLSHIAADADHHEAAWNARLDLPLRFLLAR